MAEAQQQSMVDLFRAQSDAIATTKTKDSNVFRELDRRELTEEENKIIEQRVALQRRMLEEYQKREAKRKVAEIQEAVPNMTDEQVLEALQQCGGNEMETVERLVSEPSFKARITGQTSHSRTTRSGVARVPAVLPAVPITMPANVDSAVFAGSFRSKIDRKQGTGVGKKETRNRAGSGASTTPEASTQPDGPSARITRSSPLASSSLKEARVTPGGTKVSKENGSKSSKPSSTEPSTSGMLEKKKVAKSMFKEETKADPEPVSKKQASRSQDVSKKDKPDADLSKSAKQKPAVQTHGKYVEAAIAVLTKFKGPRTIKEITDLAIAMGVLTPTGATPSSSMSVAVIGYSKTKDSLIKETKSQETRAKVFELRSSHAKSPEAQEKKGSPAKRRLGTATDALRTTPDKSTAVEHKPADKSKKGTPKKPAREEGRTSPSKVMETPSGSTRSTRGRPKAEEPTPSSAKSKGKSKASGKRKLDKLAEVDDSEATQVEDEDIPEQQTPMSGQTKRRTKSEVRKMQKEAGSPACAREGPGSRTKRQRKIPEAENGPKGTQAPSSEKLTPKSSTGKKPKTTPETGDMPKEADTPSEKSGKTPVVTRAVEGSLRLIVGASAPKHVKTASGVVRKPCRGRVKKANSKQSELIELGELCTDKGWHNQGYIFPNGYKSRVVFRSSVDTDKTCYHICEIYQDKEANPKGPMYKLTALDRPDEPIVTKSATGCWTGVLKRIQAVINQRIAAGEDLPPPPKTAIAGPEYFGLNKPEVALAIEQLDPDHLCTEYWRGQADRDEYVAAVGNGCEILENVPRERKPRERAAGNSSRSKRSRRDSFDEDDYGEFDEEDAGAYASRKWSSINRAERYRQRHGDIVKDPTNDDIDMTRFNEITGGLIDPITLDPVENPAISPYGHVMGIATWSAVLSEKQICPFTKKPLSKAQLTVLTAANIERFADKIIKN